jgi:hypothetical protein
VKQHAPHRSDLPVASATMSSQPAYQGMAGHAYQQATSSRNQLRAQVGVGASECVKEGRGRGSRTRRHRAWRHLPLRRPRPVWASTPIYRCILAFDHDSRPLPALIGGVLCRVGLPRPWGLPRRRRDRQLSGRGSTGAADTCFGLRGRLHGSAMWARPAMSCQSAIHPGRCVPRAERAPGKRACLTAQCSSTVPFKGTSMEAT